MISAKYIFNQIAQDAKFTDEYIIAPSVDFLLNLHEERVEVFSYGPCVGDIKKHTSLVAKQIFAVDDLADNSLNGPYDLIFNVVTADETYYYKVWLVK